MEVSPEGLYRCCVTKHLKARHDSSCFQSKCAIFLFLWSLVIRCFCQTEHLMCLCATSPQSLKKKNYIWPCKSENNCRFEHEARSGGTSVKPWISITFSYVIFHGPCPLNPCASAHEPLSSSGFLLISPWLWWCNKYIKVFSMASFFSGRITHCFVCVFVCSASLSA